MSKLGRQHIGEASTVSTGSLVGSYERPLDPKKRLTIPSIWRTALGADYVYVMKEDDKPCLRLIPKDVFDARLESIKEMPLSDDELNTVLEKIGEDSEMLEFDVQGRIRISDRLLAYAGLTGPVVLKGAVRMARLWAPENVPQRSQAETDAVREAVRRLRF
jgi:division/cell wall cluster transcriptional repressor MraZ